MIMHYLSGEAVTLVVMYLAMRVSSFSAMSHRADLPVPAISTLSRQAEGKESETEGSMLSLRASV